MFFSFLDCGLHCTNRSCGRSVYHTWSANQFHTFCSWPAAIRKRYHFVDLSAFSRFRALKIWTTEPLCEAWEIDVGVGCEKGYLSNKFSLNRHCGKVKDVKVCHFGSFKFPCSPRMGLWGFKVGLSHCERHPKITRIHVILQVWLDDINVIHYWYWSGHLPWHADLVSLSERRQLRQLRPFHSHGRFPKK